MKKLVILGTENCHGEIFSGYFNALKPNGEKVYPDMEVAGVYGDEASMNAIKNKIGKVEMASHPHDLVDLADGVLVTARAGSKHLEYARPYIKKGIPVFLDKPFTSSVKDAEEACAMFKEYGNAYCGGSGVKHAKDVKAVKERVKELLEKDLLTSAVLSFDIQFNDPNDGFYFYATHLIEMMIEIFGYEAKSVYALRHGDGATAIVDFGKFGVTLQFTDKCGHYMSSLFCKGFVETKEIDIGDIFKKEADIFAEVVRTGVSPQTYEQMIYPIKVAEAIDKSMQTGLKVEL